MIFQRNIRRQEGVVKRVLQSDCIIEYCEEITKGGAKIATMKYENAANWNLYLELFRKGNIEERPNWISASSGDVYLESN